MRFLLLWVLLGALAALIARNKGRSALLFFLIAVVFSPVIGILAAVLMPRKMIAAASHSNATRTCPQCSSEIKVGLLSCPRCSFRLPPVIDAESID